MVENPALGPTASSSFTVCYRTKGLMFLVFLPSRSSDGSPSTSGSGQRPPSCDRLLFSERRLKEETPEVGAHKTHHLNPRMIGELITDHDFVCYQPLFKAVGTFLFDLLSTACWSPVLPPRRSTAHRYRASLAGRVSLAAQAKYARHAACLRTNTA